MSFDIAYCSFVADHRQQLNVRRIVLEHERNPKGASKAILKEELTKGAQCLRRLLASPPPYLSKLGPCHSFTTLRLRRYSLQTLSYKTIFKQKSTN